VATPHGILITWALMMAGGIQVNTLGERFANEQVGYAEHAVEVLRQPGGIAWCLHDERIHAIGLGFPDYRDAVEAGAVRRADSLEELARLTGAPADTLAATLASVSRQQAGEEADRLGRDFTGQPALRAPWYVIRVTGALFHTQGGLAIDAHARVLRADGTPLPNLYAGGGAARGVSGPNAAGYLSGNGLLSAVNLGFLAGHDAATRFASA
jgi:fumarate reductase flavoprotein subunit